MLTQISKLGSQRQSAARQLLHDLRHQNLTAGSGSDQARETVECRGEIVASRIRHRFSLVQGHAHADRCKLVPILSQEGALSVKGGGHRVGSRGESSLDRITDHFVEHPVMRLDCLPEQGNMPIDGGGHSVATTLPERGAAFDIGEEKSDGAARQLGHGASFRRNCADAYTGYLALHGAWNGRRTLACVGSGNWGSTSLLRRCWRIHLSA